MAKELITDDHLYWKYFRDIGTHEGAGLVYIAEILWAVHEDFMAILKLQDEKLSSLQNQMKALEFNDYVIDGREKQTKKTK